MNIVRMSVIALVLPLLPLASAPATAQSLNNSWTDTSVIPRVQNAPSFYGPANNVVCASVALPAGVAPPCPAGTTLVGNSSVQSGTMATLPAGTDRIDAGLALQARGVVASPLCTTGYCDLFATVPLSSFANSRSVDAALAALQSQSVALAARADQHAWMGSAMAASLASMAPAEGLKNRAGVNMATAGGQSAVGFNYTHVEDGLDMTAGLAMGTSSSKFMAGRVGFGVSW
jgi:hypothetical protein